jgi:hypothetical protein
MLFWVVMPCGLVGRYQRFGDPENGDSMFLRNRVNLLGDSKTTVLRDLIFVLISVPLPRLVSSPRYGHATVMIYGHAPL